MNNRSVYFTSARLFISKFLPNFISTKKRHLSRKGEVIYEKEKRGVLSDEPSAADTHINEIMCFNNLPLSYCSKTACQFQRMRIILNFE